MRRSAITLVCVACAACARLEPLSLDICGNGVVEEREDCDGTTDPALGDGTACDSQRCRYVCEGAVCPAGWACASDGVCVYPSSEYDAATSPFVLTADDIRLADLDGDGRDDLIAFEAEGLRVAWAGGVGGFSPVADALTATERTGEVAIADLDGDGRPDVATPLIDGIDVELATTSRRLLPIAFSPFGPQTGDYELWHVPVRFPGVGPAEHHLILSGPHPVMAAQAEHFPPRASQPPTIFPADVPWPPPHARIPRLRLPNGNDALVVAPLASAARLIEIAPWPFGGADVFAHLHELPALPSGSGGDAATADIDGDGDVDVLLRGAAGDVRLVEMLASGLAATTSPDLRFARLAQPGDVGVGVTQGELTPWPLAIGQLAGDARADAVSANGVYLATAAGFERVYAREHDTPWHEAVIANVDGGEPDIVAAGETTGVTLLVGNAGRFTASRYLTSGRVSLLRVADVDGDGRDDVAMRVAHAGDHDALAVLFAGADELVEIGRFPRIERIEAPQLGDEDGRSDGASDLMVVSDDDSGNHVAFLRGNGQRRLRSLLTLKPANLRSERPHHLLAGRFDRLVAPRAELVAFSDGDDGASVWLFPPTPGARYHPNDARRFEAPAGWPPADCRRAVAGDADEDGLDDIIVVDDGTCGGSIRLMVYRFSTGSAPLQLARELPLAIPSLRDLASVELDGAPGRELLAVHDGGITWQPLDGNEADTRTIDGNAAVALQADRDPALELAVCDDDGMRIVEASGGELLELTRSSVGRCARGDVLRAGDINGDGLTDVARFEPAGVTAIFFARPHAEAP